MKLAYYVFQKHSDAKNDYILIDVENAQNHTVFRPFSDLINSISDTVIKSQKISPNIVFIVNDFSSFIISNKTNIVDLFISKITGESNEGTKLLPVAKTKFSEIDEKLFKPIIVIEINIDQLDRMPLSIQKILNPQNRLTFFDSSIWCKYVFASSENNSTFKDSLTHALQDIQLCESMGLYRSNVANEYFEFQSRQLKNSYVLKVIKGHSESIVPYQYHSETEFKNRIKNKDAHLKQIRWRFLLVDDYSNSPLVTRLNSDFKYKNKDGTTEIDEFHCNSKECFTKNTNEFICKKYRDKTPPKKCIIQFLLRSTSKIDIDLCEFHCVSTVDEAQELLNKRDKVYDIIFLDYLLAPAEEKIPKSDAGTKRAYGNELLDRIKKNPNSFQKGPLSRFWIFPVSVFSSAMLSSIRRGIYAHNDSDWSLSSGADPINTPYLFLFKLLTFMELMKNKCQTRFKAPPYDEDTNFRKWAINALPDIIENRRNHSLIEKQKKDSLFCKSLWQYINSDENDAPFIDHFKNLIYGISHFSSLDWKILWEIQNKTKFYFIRSSYHKDKDFEKILNEADKLIAEYAKNNS